MNDQSTNIPLTYSDPATAWPARTYYGFTAVSWGRIALLAGCLVALFWPNLRRLWLKTNVFTGEANWQHSFFVPLIGLYYLYLNREALRKSGRIADWSPRGKAIGAWAQFQLILLSMLFFVYITAPAMFAPGAKTRYAVVAIPLVIGCALLVVGWWCTDPAVFRRHRRSSPVTLQDRYGRLADSSSHWFGLSVMLWGLLFYAWSIWPGQNDFFKDVAMVIVLFGVTLMVTGWRVMQTAWFPILFLVCAIPWPGLMYSRIAMPLQQLAASVSVGTLRATGVDALRDGTTLLIGEGLKVRKLNVAEACAGLKSLMTFISVGAAVGFLSHRALWQKLLISLSAIPIAIACNVFRVAGQGLLDHYVDPKLSESFAHQFVGMIMLIPAFFMILLVGWLLDNLFIEEVDKRKLISADPATGANQAGMIIEIPRATPPGAKPAAPPRPAALPAPGDLAAATQRLMSARSNRRATPALPQGESSPPSAATPASGGQEG